MPAMKHDWFLRIAYIVPKELHQPEFLFNWQIAESLQIDAH